MCLGILSVTRSRRPVEESPEMLTIHPMPNLSVHEPNSSPHIWFSRGMDTVPPSKA